MGENRHKRSFDFFTRKWTFLVILCVSPAYILFTYFGDPGGGLLAYVSIAMTTVAVRYFWDLKRHVWFWVAVAFIASLHVILIVFVGLPEARWAWVQHWNHMQLLPFGLLDFGVAWGIIKLAEIAFQQRA
jgi:hypothetical protein